ncbi:Exonuclease/helicase-like [Trema orientale]|uniref:Exonuclease/helicase-like n=1 Tax=Trema orientale TaxID=63057 RepID=A0A2P5F4P0_TREOI|nr:Exonuclease/helicase-like [Trema orientale]
MGISRVLPPLSRVSPLYTSAFFHLVPIASAPLPFRPLATVSTAVSASQAQDASTLSYSKMGQNRWKPMCLYYTQGKCTMMDDPMHLEKFNHNCSWDLHVDPSNLNRICPQNLDFFLVLDLEGKVEILEFPVVMVDAKTMEVVDFFHRFVRPSGMSEQRINEYIEGKYGKFGVHGVWHDTAIPFKDVLQQFEAWLAQHHLWEKQLGGSLNRAAFVTCGNWDLKTKVPQQCNVSMVELPSYFMEWINLKDVYLNFYKRRATGMMTMMKELRIPSLGSHHLGFDDAKNISRVLQRMLADGALIRITARRKPDYPHEVEFLFRNRIR